jgi:hypothetical protein
VTVLEIKYCDIHTFEAVFLMDAEFSITAPFKALVTLALGYEDEEGSSYFRINLVSRDKMPISPESLVQKTWVSEKVESPQIRAKIEELLAVVNQAEDPLREAAKYLDWEYAQDIHWDDGEITKGEIVGEDLSQEFFNMG